MANDPQVGFGNAQEAGDIRAGLFVKETHDDDRAFSLAQILHATRKLIVVQIWRRHWGWLCQICTKPLEDALLSLSAAS
jgi:hypothetical protein